MRSNHALEDPRRRVVLQALATGLLCSGSSVNASGLFGNTPQKLADNRSIYRIGGTVLVNGMAADTQTIIKPGDTIETDSGGDTVFVVGTQALLLRENSSVTLQTVQQPQLTIHRGRLLSVSRNLPIRITTPTAIVGVRGTGWYAEAEEDQTYFCTCYGSTSITAATDASSQRDITSAHHDQPVYIVKDGSAGNNIRNAPMINHTDQELTLLEALVGREPPFVFPMDSYSAPRRDY